MKRIAWFLFLLIFFGCRDSQPDASLEVLKGRWQRVAVESETNGTKTWVAFDSINPYEFEYRSGGQWEYYDGYTPCCPPRYYSLNGSQKMAISFVGSLNPICALVRCAYCGVWNLQLVENELIVEACGFRQKFRKL